MIAVLVAAMSFGSPSYAWDLLARDCVAEALASIPKNDPVREMMILAEAADILEGIDDQESRKLLERAMDARKGAAEPDLSHSNLIRTMAAIDPQRAKGMLTGDSGDRHAYAAGLVLRHPDMAAPLFHDNEKAMFYSGRNLGESLDDLGLIRVDLAIAFLKRVEGFDRSYYAKASNRYLNKEEAARLVAAFGPAPAAESFWQWRNDNPEATAAEIEKQARGEKKPYDLVAGLVEALKVSRDPRLADELCKAALQPDAKPLAGSYGPEAWHDMLLPEIAVADTPRVRTYLKSLEGNKDVGQVSLAAAWSYLDIDKAVKILNAVAATTREGRVLGPHGQSLLDSYVTFLTNLARIRPVEAAKRLDAQWIMDPGGSDNGMAYLYACEIVRANWKSHPEETIKFFSQPTKYISHFDGDPKDVVEALGLAEAARAHPRASAPYLRRLAVILPTWEVHLDTGLSTVIDDVVGDVAATDTPRALELAQIDFDADRRNDALCRAIRRNRGRPDAALQPLAESALKATRTITHRVRRPFSFLYLGSTAKLKWQRAQSWPLDK